MRALVLLLAMCGAAAAAPVISNVAVNDVTAYQARITWDTDVASTSSQISVGLTDPPTDKTFNIFNDSSATSHTGFVSGLQPGKVYFFRVSSVNGTRTTSTSGSFTTLEATPGIAVMPDPPATFNTDYPASVTASYPVASDCSDLQTVINAVSGLDGNNNYEIVIPAGAVCVGHYTYPTKTGPNPTGNGFIIVRGANRSTPPGTRMTPAMSALNPMIMGNVVDSYYGTSDPGGCVAGDINTRSDLLVVKICTSPGSWTTQTIDTGSGAPSPSCLIGRWYRNTAQADPHQAFWWCVDGTYRNVYLVRVAFFSQGAAIQTTGSTTKGYRTKGVTITHVARPPSYTALLSTNSGNGDEVGSFNSCMISLQTTDQDIIFDRMYFWGRGYPHRDSRGFCFFQGARVAIINCFFTGINRWRPDGALEFTANAVMIEDGPGPAKIENNEFEDCLGMPIFGNDEKTGGKGMMSDVLISRNDFHINPRFNRYDPQTFGRLYSSRHGALEMKRGLRWRFTGNRVRGGYPGVNPNGASIGITPTVGSSMSLADCKTNEIATRHIEIDNNRFIYVPQVFLYSGRTVYGGASCQTAWGGRYAFRNNIVYKTGISETGGTIGSNNLYQFDGQIANGGLGVQDLTVRNNTFIDPSSPCCSANAWSFDGNYTNWPNSNFIFENNIYFSNVGIFGMWGIWNGGLSAGTTALNDQVLPNTSYSFNGNAFLRGWTTFTPDSYAYPGTNYLNHTVANFGPEFERCQACGDEGAFWPRYNSKFVGLGVATGYNRRDAGVDRDEFYQAQGSFWGLTAGSITTTAATIAYTAPRGRACWVEYSTSSTPLGADPMLDSGGASARNVNLTGLAAATTYYYWVHCDTTKSGTFKTR